MEGLKLGCGHISIEQMGFIFSSSVQFTIELNLLLKG